MSIGLGDTVRWIPTGEIGTVLGLTTEPSAIVDFGSRAVTIGVSLLEQTDPPESVVVAADDLASLRLLLATGLDAYLDHRHGPRLRALAARLGMRA